MADSVVQMAKARMHTADKQTVYLHPTFLDTRRDTSRLGSECAYSAFCILRPLCSSQIDPITKRGINASLAAEIAPRRNFGIVSDDKFLRLMKFSHPELKLIDFSPGERYLVTYSSHEPSNPRDTHRVILNIFGVWTGKVMREFKGSTDDFSTGGSIGVSGVPWPIFRWGGGRSDKYFARLGKNVIYVYETETFSLLDKKSLKVENVVDFSWSPTNPIISLFVRELGGGNQPAKVSLVKFLANTSCGRTNFSA